MVTCKYIGGPRNGQMKEEPWTRDSCPTNVRMTTFEGNVVQYSLYKRAEWADTPAYRAYSYDGPTSGPLVEDEFRTDQL